MIKYINISPHYIFGRLNSGIWMNGEPNIEFMYRDDQGRLRQDQTPIPLCVRCYNFKIYDRDVSYIEKGLTSKKFNPVEMAQLLLTETPQSKAHLLNPLLHCGAFEVERQQNQKNHFECALHYYIGLALMYADRECRTRVAKKIREQGLNGTVPVELMEDFNFLSHEWRVAAKYHGHSIDLYTLKFKEDCKEESEFYEADEPTIEDIIKKFFSR